MNSHPKLTETDIFELSTRKTLTNDFRISLYMRMKPCSNVEKTIIDVVYFKKYKTEDSENIAVSIYDINY